MNRNRFFVIELLTVVALVVLDLLTKQLAVKYLSDGKLTVINGVFSFTLLEGGNSGAAFGLFQGGFWIFTVITVVVIALVIFEENNCRKKIFSNAFCIGFVACGSFRKFC